MAEALEIGTAVVGRRRRAGHERLRAGLGLALAMLGTLALGGCVVYDRDHGYHRGYYHDHDGYYHH